MLERTLQEALRTGCDEHDVCLGSPCKLRVALLRSEAWRRFEGMMGLPKNLMEDA